MELGGKYIRAFAQIGQSLAEGGVGNGPVPRCAPSGAVMMQNGPVGAGTQSLGMPLVALVEKNRVTIASSFLADISGADDQLLLFHGQAWGGKTVSQLDAGGESGCFEAVVQQAQLLAKTTDLPIRYEAITCIHGEQDGINGNENYSEDLVNWYSNLSEELCRVTRQEKGPILLLSQTSSSSGYGFTRGVKTIEFPTSLAQLKAHIDHAQVNLVCPTYFLGFEDHSHLSNEGQHILGHYFAKALQTIIARGWWEPLRPLSITAIGREIRVCLTGVSGGLSLDCVSVAPIENFGFQVADQEGAEIESVRVDGESICIVLNKRLSRGAVLAYAYNNGALTRGFPSRGNVRDNDDWHAEDGCGPLYNWLVCFREPIEVIG